jgi:hypothetical protein
MKNLKKPTHNRSRDYDKVKKALIHPENKLEHFPALRKLISNFERRYGVCTEYSHNLNDLFSMIRKLERTKRLSE